MAGLVDVGLLPCDRGDCLVGARLDAGNVLLASLGRVRGQLGVVFDAGYQLAQLPASSTS